MGKPMEENSFPRSRTFMFSEMKLGHDSGHPGSLLEVNLWTSSET